MKTARKTRSAKKPSPKSRSRRTGQPTRVTSTTSHVTTTSANIFAELGFGDEEAENLRMRAMLMTELRRVIDGMTQQDASTLLRTTQPRVSHLVRGRIDSFTIDTLVNMLGHAGAKLRIMVSRPKRSSAA
ncbi:MAG TPA: helix-turn-helix transcriptional regulator [Gemmatimonadaceae bacterium]